MFIVDVDFLVHEDCRDEFHRAVLTQAGNSLEREQDCIAFDVYVDQNNPARFYLHEEYSSQEAFLNHMKTAHYFQFDELSSPWVISKTIDTREESNKKRQGA